MTPHRPTPPTGPDDASGPALADFSVDLTSHEVLRRAQVMAALGPDWDPVGVLRGEDEAYRLLYSGLDEQQQRVYEDLVAAGVLPGRGGGHAAA
ncbi:DUF6400 family protein [Streptomyces sp. NPDC058646]|uniref:DUF6400 family protein n=1 Tax=Streptomyces sp. NPDC058646 TaxID=3346574 RepID=UPI00365FD85F